MAGLIFLDTHVVVWLFAGQLERFSAALRKDLNEAVLRISPAVTLEAQYLHEIGRISVPGHEVTAELDDGPILGQARVPILPGDTPETLAARVLEQEHLLYPAVLRRFVQSDRNPILVS